MSITGILIEVVGWLGAGMLFFAYGLVSFGYIRSSGAIYQSLNLFGSACLAINTAWHGAWPSSALNVGWAAVAVGALVSTARAMHRTDRAQSVG